MINSFQIYSFYSVRPLTFPHSIAVNAPSLVLVLDLTGFQFGELWCNLIFFVTSYSMGPATAVINHCCKHYFFCQLI